MELLDQPRPSLLLQVLAALAALILIQAPTVLAQTPEWEQVFLGADMYYARSVVPLANGYLVVGPTYPTGTRRPATALWALSESGHLLWKREIGEWPASMPQKAIRVGRNVAILGRKSEVPYDSMAEDAFCVIVDSTGSVIAQHVYPQLWGNDVVSAFATSDGGMFVGVTGIPSRILRLDSVGTLLWSRSDIWVHAELPSGDLVNTRVTWFDPKGEQRRTIVYTETDYEAGRTICPLPDGGLMLTNGWTSDGGWNITTLFIYRIGVDSIARNRTVWGQGGAESEIRDMQPDGDGMLFAGTFDNSMLAGPTASIDRVSADGVGTWRWHAPTRTGIESGFERAVRTRDGGIIAVGYEDGQIARRSPYIVKFRSAGPSGIPQSESTSEIDLR